MSRNQCFTPDDVNQPRFAARISAPDHLGCQHFKAAGKRNPVFRVKRLLVGAHRVAYTLAHGAIPSGGRVLRRCGTSSCVSPQHLYLVGPAEAPPPGPAANGALALLDDTIRAAIDDSRSSNTRRTYRSQWGVFSAWANELGLTALPATPHTIARYLAARAEAGSANSTLRAACAIIGAAHRDAGMEDPTKVQAVRLVLSGLTRRNANPVNQVSALLDSNMDAIVATALLPRTARGGRTETKEYARRRGLVDIALVLVMQNAGLRRSEAAALTWADVATWEDGSGRITIRRSKTDQFGVGAVVAITARAMNALDAIRQPEPAPDSPVFGLSESGICLRIKSAARAAGLSGRFGGHSGRVGMARTMISKGAPTPVVQRQGRWKSADMITSYTRAEASGEALRWL